MKTQFVQGGHDWLSTLTSVSGFHRVSNTALHPSHMAISRENGLETRLHTLAGHQAVAAVMLTSMPMAFVTGADYERLCRQESAVSGKCIAHVPGKSLSGDWLDGYAETLLALAKTIPIRRIPDKKNADVAIVGYLYDRNEQDHGANIRHLRGLLESAGLRCVSIWLEGQSFNTLERVSEAGAILSFPYGRKAAQVLARRTGARCIECELPFGLDATERWLRTVGSALDVEVDVANTIDQQLSKVVPSLEWVIPFHFQGRRMAYVGDPYMAVGMKEIATMVGAELAAAVITNPPHSCVGLAPRLQGTELLVWPKQQAMREFLHRTIANKHISLLVTNQHGVGVADIPWLEIGYPCMYRHALYDCPFLGFQGLLSFVGMLANAQRQHEVALAMIGHQARNSKRG